MKVKVRMLETLSGMVDGNEHPQRGDVIEVDEVVADDLCDRPEGAQLAERVKGKPTAAAVEAPEKAVRPRPRRTKAE
jgi:hypothetical protein